MDACVFCKIVQGEIPAHKIYEDDKTLAFLDIHPVQPGMVLVVTKTHEDHFMDLNDENYQALMASVKKVARHMHEAFPDKRIGVQIEGLDLSHVHVKLIPITSGEEFRTKPNMQADPDHAALAEMAEKLKI